MPSSRREGRPARHQATSSAGHGHRPGGGVEASAPGTDHQAASPAATGARHPACGAHATNSTGHGHRPGGGVEASAASAQGRCGVARHGSPGSQPSRHGGTAAGQRGTRHRLGQHRGTAPGQRGTGHQLGQHRHRHRPGGTLAPKKFFENLGARNFCYGGGPWFESARDLTPPPVPARACRPEVRPASPATANRPAGHQASAAHCQAQQAPSTSAARTPSPCNAGAESAEVRKLSIHAGLRPVGSAGSSAGSAESLAPLCPPSAANGRRSGPHHTTPLCGVMQQPAAGVRITPAHPRPGRTRCGGGVPAGRPLQ